MLYSAARAGARRAIGPPTIERSILEQALRKTGGNKKAAAEMLHLKRTTLAAKVRSLESWVLYS